MADLTAYSNKLNVEKMEMSVIIETPKGRRNKFDYDAQTNLFKLGGLLPEGMAFPYDFGFVPSTLGGDGDPLDVLVMMDEPAHVGCLVDVRVIGVIEAEQTQEGKTETNNRLLAVAVHSYTHEHIKSIKDVNQSLLDQLEAFFVSYNKLRGKKFKIRGQGGPKRALAVIKSGMKEFEKKNG